MLGNAEQAAQWLQAHPKILRGMTTGLVIFAVFNLVKAIQLDRKATLLIGEWQKAASEALGG